MIQYNSRNANSSVNMLFSRGDEILLNRESGFLVRTKSTEHADGGVFAGRAAFDSLYMV